MSSSVHSETASATVQAREVRTLFGVSFLTRSVSIIIQTVAPIVLSNVLDLPTTSLGWVIAGFWMANALGSLLAAGLIRSRRRSILIGFMLLSASFAGLALYHEIAGYAFFVIINGLALAMVQAFLVPSMYKSGTKERPQLGIANYSMALSLGMVVGPACASIAIFFYGFSVLFGILSGVALATFVLCAAIGFQKLFQNEDTLGSIKPSNIIRTIKKKGFANYYALNFFYSMLLPIFLSYGGIYGEKKFGLGAELILALFALVFGISTAMRSIFTRAQIGQFKTLLISGFAVLVLSFALVGASENLSLYLVGFLLFSIPHALIYPATTFMALESGGRDSLISSSYLFATSSGVAEFLSPLIAVPIIALYNISGAFLIMVPIAGCGMIFSLVLGEVGSSPSHSTP